MQAYKWGLRTMFETLSSPRPSCLRQDLFHFCCCWAEGSRSTDSGASIQWLPPPLSPSTGITDASHRILLFIWVPRIAGRSSGLRGKQFYLQNHLPGPQLFLNAKLSALICTLFNFSLIWTVKWDFRSNLFRRSRWYFYFSVEFVNACRCHQNRPKGELGILLPAAREWRSPCWAAASSLPGQTLTSTQF